MRIIPTLLKDAFIIQLDRRTDERGDFVKTFHAGLFEQHGLDTDFKESYYSTSVKDVIRGMHFQLPPHHHSKLVYAVEGEALDVLLDLRKSSPTFGKCCTANLSKNNANAVYIPKGIAHGFGVLSNSATLVYMTTTVYNNEADTGIRWDSFGFDWQIDKPLISDRDQQFVEFKDFESPF